MKLEESSAYLIPQLNYSFGNSARQDLQEKKGTEVQISSKSDFKSDLKTNGKTPDPLPLVDNQIERGREFLCAHFGRFSDESRLESAR